jgi:hypothetical protein
VWGAMDLWPRGDTHNGRLRESRRVRKPGMPLFGVRPGNEMCHEAEACGATGARAGTRHTELGPAQSVFSSTSPRRPKWP